MQNVILGDWTLVVYPGRVAVAGSLPAASPEVVLYKGWSDLAKGTTVADDRVTPWDSDFAELLRAAIVEQARRNTEAGRDEIPDLAAI